MAGFLTIIVPFLSVVVIALLIALIFTSLFKFCYKTCPPNKAMVITGPTGASTVIGKAKFIIPLIQRVDYMSLENIQVDFTSRDEMIANYLKKSVKEVRENDYTFMDVAKEQIKYYRRAIENKRR